MITKYFTKVTLKFNPLNKDGKVARVFLAAIPPSMKGACQIDNQVLTNDAKTDPIIKVTFKDKKVIEADPRAYKVQEIFNLLDRHSRLLAVKESIL